MHDGVALAAANVAGHEDGKAVGHPLPLPVEGAANCQPVAGRHVATVLHRDAGSLPYSQRKPMGAAHDEPWLGGDAGHGGAVAEHPESTGASTAPSAMEP